MTNFNNFEEKYSEYENDRQKKFYLLFNLF